jgi:peptide deformylase
MAVLEIVTLPNPILRQKTRQVTRFDTELQQLIDDMIETMRAAPGVGLAAPQVGRPLSLSVIETLPKLDEEGSEIEESRELFVIINPEVIWRSREELIGVEGCLSIPGYVGEVDRAEKIRVRALDRNGRKIRLRLSGWTARIFQHEIDHLNGILYIDKLTDKENFWTDEEFAAMLEEEEKEEAAAAE